MSLQKLRSRLSYLGGFDQQDRMIHQKRKSFDAAVKCSYQGAKLQEADSLETWLGLINPDNVTQDYDEKIISIGFESKFKTGTVFKWLNTNSYWLIYLQDLTELAYFKGRVRRCSHKISWKTPKGEMLSSYITLIGPSEKKMKSLIKENFVLDVPNYSLQLLVPNTPQTLEYFQRYAKFYLQGLNKDNPQRLICWRVEAVDSISSPGVIEVYAAEDYSNSQTDDLENGIVDGLIVSPIDIPSEIKGESTICPSQEYEYTYTGTQAGQWTVISVNPVDIQINDKTIKIIWTKLYGGEVVLRYGDAEKHIKVKSLF